MPAKEAGSLLQPERAMEGLSQENDLAGICPEGGGNHSFHKLRVERDWGQ